MGVIYVKINEFEFCTQNMGCMFPYGSHVTYKTSNETVRSTMSQVKNNNTTLMFLFILTDTEYINCDKDKYWVKIHIYQFPFGHFRGIYFIHYDLYG